MADLTKKYRPKTFEEVIGQPLAVKILKAIAKKPEQETNCIILSGDWGCGKTTLARIFGRALNCESFKTTGKICLKCKGCLSWGETNNRYIEYDSSSVGNVNQIKDLKPVFGLYTDFYRVIVLDEAHLISRQAQSALLKELEEGTGKTFFVLCSTDPDDILKTIHSRSTPVEIFKVDNATMTEFLQRVYNEEREDTDKEISKDILDKIAFKADGHVRDALKLLANYMREFDEEVLNLPINDIKDFFIEVAQGKNDEAILRLQKNIMKYPVSQVHRSLNYVVLQLVATYARGVNTVYSGLAKFYGVRVLDIFDYVAEMHVQGVFKDRYLTTSLFLTFIKKFGK